MDPKEKKDYPDSQAPGVEKEFLVLRVRWDKKETEAGTVMMDLMVGLDKKEMLVCQDWTELQDLTVPEEHQGVDLVEILDLLDPKVLEDSPDLQDHLARMALMDQLENQDL